MIQPVTDNDRKAARRIYDSLP